MVTKVKWEKRKIINMLMININKIIYKILYFLKINKRVDISNKIKVSYSEPTVYRHIGKYFKNIAMVSKDLDYTNTNSKLINIYNIEEVSKLN